MAYNQSMMIADSISELSNINNTYCSIVLVRDNDRTSGNPFRWVANATPNGGTIYAGLTGFWEMMYNGVINVKWFGAKGDGATNDTANFQQALSYVFGIKGTLYIPRGEFLVSNLQINLPNTPLNPHPIFNIIGEGQDVSIIKKYGDNSDPIFSFSGTTQIPVDAEFQNEISNFTINGFTTNGGVNGFYLNNYARFCFRNILAINCSIAYNCQGVLVGSFYNCTIKKNRTGLKFIKSSQNFYNNVLNFYSCVLNSNSEYAIDFNNGNSVNFFGCDFEANGTSTSSGSNNTCAIIFRSEVAQELGTSIFSFENCWFENNLGGNGTITVETASIVYKPSFTFTNCTLVGTQNGVELDIKDAQRVSIIQCDVPSSNAKVKINSTFSWVSFVLITELIDTSSYKNHFNVGTATTANKGWSTDVEVSNGKSLKLTWPGGGLNEISSDTSYARLIIKPESGNPLVVQGNVWCMNDVGDGATYNTPHFVMGNYHLWVDNGKLMIKDGPPANNADGTIVGTQS